MKSLIFPLAVCACMFLFVGYSAASADFGVIILPNDQSAALTAIRTSEAQGKDVSGMVADYNSAIGLIEKFSAGTFGNCNTSASCLQLQHAKQILQSIADQSPGRLEYLTANPQQNIVFIVVGSAVGAFVASLIIIFTYSAWKQALARRFGKMQVRGKDQ